MRGRREGIPCGCSELNSRVAGLSSDPDYEGAWVSSYLVVDMVEGGPVAAVGVKQHCRWTACQRRSSPGRAGCVYDTRLLSAFRKDHLGAPHLEGLPAV